MRVICFRGKNNVGKSNTIRKILNNFFGIHLVRKEYQDFSLAFTHDGKRIGICSYGDDLRALEKWLLPLKKYDCEIIICATRTQGDVSRYIDRIFGKENVRYIDCEGKGTISSQNKENSRRIAEFKRMFKF